MLKGCWKFICFSRRCPPPPRAVTHRTPRRITHPNEGDLSPPPGCLPSLSPGPARWKLPPQPGWRMQPVTLLNKAASASHYYMHDRWVNYILLTLAVRFAVRSRWQMPACMASRFHTNKFFSTSKFVWKFLAQNFFFFLNNNWSQLIFMNFYIRFWIIFIFLIKWNLI